MSQHVSRRSLLLSAGAASAGAALLGGGYALKATQDVARADEQKTITTENSMVSFYGSHQAGIVTSAQIQTKLARYDLLNEYITHTGSAIFACPAGASQTGFVGDTLFTK